jgi:uncharacterized protein (DUF427 family)
VKLPGPNHPIAIEHNPKRVRIWFNGRVIAETRDALTLREASLPAVFYIPREDADMAVFERTAHTTYCPYKGEASYFSVRIGDKLAQNAVWTYETPFPAMKEITGRLAFYRNRVDLIEEC